MSTQIDPNDLILVAVIKEPRDLDIVRVLGWYRIPVRTAPKTLQIDWLAFFQTAAFHSERWSIRYYCRVQGYELSTRRDLILDEPDHPRAGEPYFKIQLGPLLSLSRPIPARRWRRFTFLYTTGDRLLGAGELTDLRLPAAIKRNLFWLT
jgi:hypothetical protein